MNGGLDLRSPEYIASLRFFTPSMVKIITTGMLAAALLGACIGGYAYSGFLQEKVALNEAALLESRKLAVSLVDLAENTARLEARSLLLEDARLLAKSGPQYLQIIKDKAAVSNLEVYAITIDSNGHFGAAGKGHLIGDIAIFNQALKDHRYFTASQITSIEMDSEYKYRFEIKGVLPPESGVEIDDQ